MRFKLITVFLAAFLLIWSCSSESSSQEESKTDDFVETKDDVQVDNEVADDTVDPVCGNEIVEAGEACDGGEKDCTEIDPEKWG